MLVSIVALHPPFIVVPAWLGLEAMALARLFLQLSTIVGQAVVNGFGWALAWPGLSHGIYTCMVS